MKLPDRPLSTIAIMDIEYWQHRLPGLEPLWQQTHGARAITVAVLDGAVDLEHPCFVGAELHRVESVVPAEPVSSHGTGVASILFAQPGSGFIGLAPRCTGLIVPIFATGRRTVTACSQVDLARAIGLALEHGANVINISGGQLDAGGEASPILAKAIRDCAEQGVLVVAAAGNDGCDCLHVPAAEPSVLAVGAIDNQDRPIDVSNWGRIYQTQGIVAPGKGVPAAAAGGGVEPRTGTSWAAPIVSGVAALLLSLQLERGQTPDVETVRNLLLGTARGGCDVEPGPECRRLLVGRLDVAAAMSELSEMTSTAVTAAGCDSCAGTDPEQRSSAAPSPDLSPQPEGEEAGIEAVEVDKDPAVRLQATEVETADLAVGTVQAASVEESAVPKADAEPIDEVLPTVQTADAEPANEAVTIGQAVDPGQVVAADAENVIENLTPTVRAAEVEEARPKLAYVLGQVGYDFGTEARRDSFLQQGLGDPHGTDALLTHLTDFPAQAEALTFTLNQEKTPIYAIVPTGPFAAEIYAKLRELLHTSVERASIPGWVYGTTTLMNGHTVPVIRPELRGICAWSTQAKVSSVLGPPPSRGKRKKEDYQEKAVGIAGFLERVYYEIRNLGMAAPERAMNYAATRTYQLTQFYTSALQSGLKFGSIDVERSSICRPKSDCWDVKLTFFDPKKRLEQLRKIYLFTVDVSDVVPVSIGKVHNWYF